MQQHHVSPPKSTPPAQPLDDASVTQTLELSALTVVMRSSSAPEPVHSASEELDRWSLVNECYREQMARRALEELFAAGAMSALEY